MNKMLIVASSLALSASLAGCKKEAEAPQAAATPSGADKAMSNMSTGAAVQQGSSTGTITAIDAAKGTVTLNHKEIAALRWPGMTMSFAATAEQLKDLKVGDHVEFELDWDGKSGLITKITKI